MPEPYFHQENCQSGPTPPTQQTNLAHNKPNQSWHFIILSLACFLQVCLPRPWPCDRGCSVYIKTDIIEIVGGRRCRTQPVVVNLSYHQEPQRQWPTGGSTLEARLTALCCSWQRASPIWVYWFATNREPTEIVMYCLTSDLNLFYLPLIRVWCFIGVTLSKPSKNVQQLGSWVEWLKTSRDFLFFVLWE